MRRHVAGGQQAGIFASGHYYIFLIICPRFELSGFRWSPHGLFRLFISVLFVVFFKF